MGRSHRQKLQTAKAARKHGRSAQTPAAPVPEKVAGDGLSHPDNLEEKKGPLQDIGKDWETVLLVTVPTLITILLAVVALPWPSYPRISLWATFGALSLLDYLLYYLLSRRSSGASPGRRRLRIACLSVWGTVLLLCVAGHLFITTRPSQAPPPGTRLGFRPAGEKFTINLGDRVFITRPAELADKPFEPLILKGTVPFRAYIEGGLLYVDASVFTGDTAEPVIEIARNQYKRIPPGWDVNSTPAALEIVNERGEPVFHLIYKSPSEAKVEGVFQTPDGAYVIDEHGQGYGLKPDIKPVFKYPSWKYPGQYADPAPARDERGAGRRRQLTEEQSARFIEVLKSQPPPREEVVIGCPAASEEACVFAAKFLDLFQEAGWAVRDNQLRGG